MTIAGLHVLAYAQFWAGKRHGRPLFQRLAGSSVTPWSPELGKSQNDRLGLTCLSRRDVPTRHMLPTRRELATELVDSVTRSPCQAIAIGGFYRKTLDGKTGKQRSISRNWLPRSYPIRVILWMGFAPQSKPKHSHPCRVSIDPDLFVDSARDAGHRATSWHYAAFRRATNITARLDGM